MSADNFNKKPDNSINQDEELAAILQRLSTLLDKSVSLDEAIELAKQQSNSDSFEEPTEIEEPIAKTEVLSVEVKDPIVEIEVPSTEVDPPIIETETTSVVEEEPQSNKSMPVSDFIKLLKSKHFEEEIEENSVTETEDEATEKIITLPETAPVEEEITTATEPEKVISEEETKFENENLLITEKKPIVDELTDFQNAIPDEESYTSNIFDELLACFDGYDIPDDLHFSDNQSAKEECGINEETTETQTETKDVSDEKQEYEETEEEPTSEFVPIEHENPEEDELFSKIFSEEKSERKNRERDKKKWQKTGDEPSAFLAGLYDWLEVIVLSASFALLLFTFILRLAIVDGDSMNHTLHDKELLIISDLMYTPENNDIIVFTSPNYPEPIVKRIIATEGQTVDIDFDTWTVTVDGKVLKEDYINRVIGSMKSADVAFPLTVPEGYVFVMGDNRNDSLDSRNSRIGFVDERFVLGEVKLRIFPLDRFGTVN